MRLDGHRLRGAGCGSGKPCSSLVLFSVLPTRAARRLVGKQFRPSVVGMARTGTGVRTDHGAAVVAWGRGGGGGRGCMLRTNSDESIAALTPRAFRPPDSKQKKLKDTGRYDSIQVRTAEPSSSALPQAGEWLTTSTRPTLNLPLLLCAYACAPLLLLLLLLFLLLLRASARAFNLEESRAHISVRVLVFTDPPTRCWRTSCACRRRRWRPPTAA